MAGPDDGTRYLFDDEALERALAGGTEAQHNAISGCGQGILFVTKGSKGRFLAAFPDEKEKLSAFELMKKRVQDNYAAANFADQLQNYPDVENDAVQEKIFLLATAAREEITVVTGEYVSPTTRIKVLAEQVGVR